MTAFSKTLKNMLNPFSNAETLSLWGSMVWGTDPWGYSPGAQTFDVVHYMSASGPILSSAKGSFDIVHYMSASGPVLSSAKGGFGIVHYVSADGPTLDSTNTFDTLHYLPAQTLVVSGDLASEELKDAQGYIYVYGNQEDAEDRVLTSFTSGTPVDVTWVVGTAGSTVWS